MGSKSQYFPAEFVLPKNWYEADKDFEKELKRELRNNQLHPLYGVEAISVAYRGDKDDVLFLLKNHHYQLATVHLSWNEEHSLEWPSITFYKSWQDWQENSEKGC